MQTHAIAGQRQATETTGAGCRPRGHLIFSVLLLLHLIPAGGLLCLYFLDLRSEGLVDLCSQLYVSSVCRRARTHTHTDALTSQAVRDPDTD